ncbi:L-gulonolactone oxidase-like isoform X2 [Lineus longissimus]
MKKFNRLVDVNHEKNQVTVEAGITMNDLNKLLKDNGMGFSVLGAISGISVGGMISTGTHGTGKNYGCSSTHVVDLELMTANGDIIKCSRQEKPETFLCACCSLGSLGVILRVTLQCEPAFNLLSKVYPAELDDILEHLDVHLSSSDHFRFQYYPYTGKVEVFHDSRTDKPIEKKKTSWFWDTLCGFHLFQLLYWISSFIPFLVKYVNHFIFWLLHSKQEVYVDWAPSVFNFNCLFEQFVNEWSIPRENTALVLKELQAWIINNDYPAHIPIEVRFVKGDDIYLSPASGRDVTYINIICFKPFGKFVPHDEYWRAYQKIAAENGGRPHWAKAHGLTGSELKTKYPKWDAFCQVRESLDPAGMFLNENLKRTFN